MNYVLIEGAKNKGEYQFWSSACRFSPWKGSAIVCAGGRQNLFDESAKIAAKLADSDSLTVCFDKTPSVWAHAFLDFLGSLGGKIEVTKDFSFEEMLFVSCHPKLAESQVRELYTSSINANKNPFSDPLVVVALNMPQYKNGWLNREKVVAIELTKVAKGSAEVIKKRIGRCWKGGSDGSLECEECGLMCVGTSIFDVMHMNSRSNATVKRRVLLTKDMTGVGADFVFDLRGRVTIASDVSGAGKTLLCDALLTAQATGLFSDVRVYNAGGMSRGNTILPTTASSLLSELQNLAGYLVVIDEADELLGSQDLRFYIERDLQNDYLLLARDLIRCSVGATVANVASVVDSGGQKCLSYKYNYGGW